MATYKFVLKHVFKNMSEMTEVEACHNDNEEHFGIPWCIFMERSTDNLSVFLYCGWQEEQKEWSIDTEFEVHVFHPNGNSICKTIFFRHKEADRWGWQDIMTLETMRKEYVFKDELIVEIRLKSMKTMGIYKDNLRDFDDKECSDVALVASDKRYHVSKLYLCTHSSYFKSLFLGGSEESKKSEIKLNDVDADDFQQYLEELYVEDAIDEMTVEGILLLADKFATKILIQKCEEFLLESSTKTLKKNLEMAVRYNLCELKHKCLSKINTISDIRSVISGYINQMDPSLTAILLEKTLALV